LLGRDDPPPAVVINEGGASPFLLLGDHAGRLIPRRLGDLGLPPEAMDRHIAWDIGVAGLGEKLSGSIDACFVRQTYSRLVIDCNRAPDAVDAVPEVSDGVAIPGNVGLNAADLAARRDEIHAPYQARIAALIAERAARGQPTLLVSLHSFTPVMRGFQRPWRYGVLHRNDSALSARALALLRAAQGDTVGDNQPYAMDVIDHTIPLHADANGLEYLELEVRQDLIADEAGLAEAAAMIAELLPKAAEGL
jgi:predicted N-formylglutamate amidohydrolase